MKIPVIHGYIERRILINYVADPSVVKKLLPEPFRPQLYKSYAVAGICLIRLTNIKPKGLPDMLGVRSENAAHRFAVEWNDKGQTKSGVYIPRRDTSLRLNAIAGGRIFPGKHLLANFNVKENESAYNIVINGTDGLKVEVAGTEARGLEQGSVFNNLESVSDFFKSGSLGYSPGRGKFDGLELKTYKWEVIPMAVSHLRSGFFDNEELFPKGSIKFDNALLMKNIEHEWHSYTPLHIT